MRKIIVQVDKSTTINLGYAGENLATVVVFDISQWVKEYGRGKADLLLRMDGSDAPYPCTVEIKDTCAEWIITNSELASAKKGKCQLVYHVGDTVIAKSSIFQTNVNVSLSEETADPPESFISWVDKVLAAGVLAENSADWIKEEVKQLNDTVQLMHNQIVQTGSEAVKSVQDAAKEKIEQIEGIAGLLPSVTVEDNGKILMVVDGKWKAQMPVIDSWKDIQNLVRLGLAPKYFPIGYEFSTHDSTEDTDIIWVVRGFDTIKAADETLSHTMILESKYVYCNSSGNGISLQFDAPEALYYAENGLEAGVYHFTLLREFDVEYGGGKTYFFTLKQSVPAGGIIMFPWKNNQQVGATKISTYASQTDTQIIETVGVVEGTSGIYLGTADGSMPNMNHTHRIRYGSSNYAQSSIRQWLNSQKAAGSIWIPQTRFDRPSDSISDRAGFMAGLPKDFLSVVQSAVIPCCTNNVFEMNSLDGTAYDIRQVYNLEDKFFILSRPEIYGSWDDYNLKDGELLEFYTGLTDAERIKYNAAGLQTDIWLRSLRTDYASFCRKITITGNFSDGGASNNLFIVPACIIA